MVRSSVREGRKAFVIGREDRSDPCVNLGVCTIKDGNPNNCWLRIIVEGSKNN